MKQPPYIGQSPGCRETERLVTGQGAYVADIPLKAPLYITFVRSTVANARISGCKIEEALAVDGVFHVHRGADLKGLGALSINDLFASNVTLPYPVLAHRQVEAVGQPVAAILSENRNVSEDSAGLVEIDYQPLDSTEQHGPDHTAAETELFSHSWEEGDADRVFNRAEHCVEVEIDHPLISPSPMENRAIAISYNRLTETSAVWLSTQTPHRARQELVSILNIDPARLHVIAPDVGGAFGMKASLYPEEVFAVWAAFHHRRDIKWEATRSEDLLSASHGRGIHSAGKLAFNRDGKFLALIAQVTAPIGCWMTHSSQVPAWNACRILPGPYDVDSFRLGTRGVKTHTAPIGIYRGAGRPEAAMLMERLADKAAKRLAMDPMEIRNRNLVRPIKLPLKRSTGARLDSGDYPLTLERLRCSSDYPSLRQHQSERRNLGDWVGLGIGFFVEPCGRGWESAKVKINPDGSVQVNSGGSSQGHSRRIAYAQIAAQALGCEIEKVSVSFGDTRIDPPGIGALASRSTAIGGSAVWQAAKNALEEAAGCFPPAKVVETSVKYHAKHEVWGHGAYLAQVSIEPDTGKLTIEQIYCIDDAGILINPSLVEGQIAGGIVQGIGESTLEAHHYTKDGQLMTGSLMDYGLPRADQVPPLMLEHVETPTNSNLLGAKGVGEAGTIGAPCAIYNAAIDALSPLEIEHIALPLNNQNIWNAIQSAKDHRN